MKNMSFNILERDIEYLGRSWDRIEDYELDEDDWLLFNMKMEYADEKIYENNMWGGLIRITKQGEFYISYI